MGLVADIVMTYRSPRAVMGRHLAGGSNEGRVLMYLVLACGLHFMARWPGLRRDALLDASVPLDFRLNAALFGWMFVAPLALYAVALVARLLAGVFGGQGTGYTARLALFWSLVATAPLWLVNAAVTELTGIGYENLRLAVASAVFLLFWGLSMIESEIGGARP